jgi:hypothetical protein
MRIIGCRAVAVLALIGFGVLAAPGVAEAWWHHGPRWHGGFYYVAPPVYVPPPVYVAPPVYQPYYAPPAYSQYDAPPARYAGPPPAAGDCSAGPYICPLGGPATVGQSCACDTPQGRIWGHTN